MPTAIFTVVLAYIAILILPGPNFIMTATNAIIHSRRMGLFTAMGVAVGTSIHGTAGLAGLFLVVLQSSTLYTVVKVIGAGYLIYIGVKTLLHKPITFDLPTDMDTSSINPRQAFRSGILTNLSNPKTAIFFLSVFTSFITPDMPLWAKILTVALMALSALVWYCIVAVMFSQPPIRSAFTRLGTPIKLMIGTIFIFFGIRVAASQH